MWNIEAVPIVEKRSIYALFVSFSCAIRQGLAAGRLCVLSFLLIGCFQPVCFHSRNICETQVYATSFPTWGESYQECVLVASFSIEELWAQAQPSLSKCAHFNKAGKKLRLILQNVVWTKHRYVDVFEDFRMWFS